MKKLIILTLAAVSFTVASFGQQVPMYSHYYFNRFLYNPAMTGETSYGQAYLLYRNQWNSVAGAPETRALTIDGPLRNKKVGLGFSFFQDEAGAFNSTGGKLSYRYGLQLSKESMLNFGLSLGFLDNRVDFNDLRVQRPEDYVILNQYDNQIGFDATFGLNYVWKDLQIGLAVPQVLANEFAYESIGANINDPDITYGLVRHFIASARYDLKINDNLTFEPVALVRATPNTPVQYDINAMFNFQDKYWLGAMYRSQYAATFSAAAKLFNQVVAGYSFDYVVNQDRQYLRGAHEVMIGYQFGITDNEALKKRFKGIDDKIKKNEDDIKQNREDIDSNDEEIEEDKKDLEEKADKIQKEIDDLRSEFEKFKEDAKSGNVTAGDVVRFTNVYFETDKSDIRDVDASELDNLVSILKENKNMSIGIYGHADKRGAAAANQILSRSRAESVRQYLISKGIESYRLRLEAFGESAPASDALDENRRVEFKVLSK